MHLHTHTEFSLLDGAARIDELVRTAQSLGQPAISITDHGVLYGAIDFYTSARAAGINPIIGCEVYMAQRSRHDKEQRVDRDPWHLVLLAKNNTGYRNLVQLVSKAHLEGFYQKPRIDHSLLAEHSEGLICLSACIGGELPQAILSGDMDAAERVARRHMEILGPDNYFLELQDHGIPEETAIREGLVEIARRTGLPMVCTNDSHYIRAEDAEAHDILLCIQTGARQREEKRFRFSGPDFYVTSGDAMRRKFAAYGEAAANTVALASRVNVEFDLGHNLLPAYSPIPAGLDADSYLKELAEKGLIERYGVDPPREARQRLAMELDVIKQTGFSAYFLIVWDLIHAARCEGVQVGPGRGSAAGSIVSYVLRITNICPLRYGLIFERFLNLERVQMPDIDIDFDDRRRGKALDYAERKYGRERVAQIITFGTMAARAALRDVGRALDIPLPDVDRIAKLVPQTVGITLDQALKETKELRDLYEAEDWAKRVVDNARRLEGICRNASTHAAAVVIGAEPLVNTVPLARNTSGDREGAVTQFDMNGVAKIGLLKIDFLGLTNLSVIDECVQNIKKVRGETVEMDSIPLDDHATYELFSRADTYGVFQSEGGGAKKVLIDMQPRNLEDIAVAGALNRPGPIEGGVIDIYMRRKRGVEPISYPLPQLEPILAETYGTIVYQDQVMKIASAVAGYSLGEADILRAAMGKKNKEKMAKERVKFLAGAAERGVDEKTAGELFDLMAFFAGYGFNKAHAVAYGLITYQTAYLKANYPLEYMAALLNSKASDLEKVKACILDARARNLNVLPPDVNRSASGFSVGNAAGNEILYGLSVIRNVGDKVIEHLIDERTANGPFTSLLDLCMRVNTRELNRRVLEALIRSGACDCLGERALMLALLDRAMDRAAAIRRERDSGQTALFGDTIEAELSIPTTAQDPDAADDLGTVAGVAPAAEDTRLSWERELLGMYLSSHPLHRVAEKLSERTDTPIGDMGGHLDGLIVQVGGAIREVRAFVPKRSTTGQRMAFMQLEDLSGHCEVVVFARVFEEAVNLLKPDAVVVVRGKVESRQPVSANGPADDEHQEQETPKIIAEAIYALDDVRLVAWRRNALVHITVAADQEQAMGPLRQIFARHRGESNVVLHIEGAESFEEIALPEDFSVEPGIGLESEVESLLGTASYRLEVRRDKAPEREQRWKRN